MNDTNQTIALIDLFGKEFKIPHYQRGYRWEEQEVEDLLNDLWAFEKTSDKGEFYCLQPIVVQQIGDVLHVLDGQQRLTTLYLIITFLEEIRNDSGYTQPLFSLNYETRGDCEEFLRSRRFLEGLDESNIDYYHISSAYQIIKNWFSNPKHAGAKMKLVPILMDSNAKTNRNVRFIWYEVENNVNPIDIFVRLNVGKIPLTDSELVKALLLQADKYDPDDYKFIKMQLFEIATEWDTIEYQLQNEDFWFFLNNQVNAKPTHIEFIFDLIAERLQNERKYFDKKPSKHATFLILSAHLQQLLDSGEDRIAAVAKIWDKVTEYFEYFLDWFTDRQLFHYIGYLIAQKGNFIIDSLILQSKQYTKKDFISYLESEIGKWIFINKTRKDADGNHQPIELAKLRYEYEDQKSNDRGEILRILLLHNVFASLKSDKECAKFPFNLYKHTKDHIKWSLEHIHAQNSEYLVKRESQNQWLKDHIQSFKSQGNHEHIPLIDQMQALLEKEIIEKSEFEAIVNAVYNAVSALAGDKKEEMHAIANLCLVDVNTNSLLNNSVFDVKRQKIKERELAGHYIPVSTRNIFLKGYTSYPISNAYWTDSDRKEYLGNLSKMYNYFKNSRILN